MFSKVMMTLAAAVLCILGTAVSAGLVAAPLAAGIVAPYATSYNAHTVNHNIAAPYVAAAPVAAPLLASNYATGVVPVAKYVAAGPVPYTAAASAPFLPAVSAYGATYPYLL